VLRELTASPPPTDWGVEIDEGALARYADHLAAAELRTADYDYPGVPDLSGAAWCDFVVLGVSVVACLWAPDDEPTWQFELDGTWLDDAPAVWACFTRRIRSQGGLHLSSFSGMADHDGFFGGRGTLQLVPERIERLRAAAGALERTWNGTAGNLVQEADHDARVVADLLIDTVPGYRDRPETEAGILPFDKLALLAASMISSRVPLTGLEHFPVFPDYMLPRNLRYQGVLVYEPELAEAVDRRAVIAEGSHPEHAIRWATVHTGARLLDELLARGRDIPPTTLDYHLWYEAVLGPEAAEMGEHHRTVTLAY
jgi:hypothetical protein